MREKIRKLFPYFALFVVLASVVYAVTLDRVEPADFTFNNGTEVKTVDPPKAEGQPEGRILDAVFEGLLRMMPVDQEPDENGIIPLYAAPGVAESFEVSEDGKVYTFHLRPDAKWSNGRTMTADDFVFSWQRYMHPDTESQYAYQLHYVAGAKDYNLAKVKVGDHVEVELYDRPGVKNNPRGNAKPDEGNQTQPFPRGTVLKGVLVEIVNPPELVPPKDADKKLKDRLIGEWESKITYVVELKPKKNGVIDWEAKGKVRAFAREPAPSEISYKGEIEKCHFVLIDWDSEVGVKAEDDRTLVVTLNNRTPFFEELAAFYTLYPTNRECIETWGSPDWTKPENIVSNGPFILYERRLRDRIRLRKNDLYWGANDVHLNTVDALTVNSETTDLNMFLSGQLDWGVTVPNAIIPELKKRNEQLIAEGKKPEFLTNSATIVYFYRINVTRPPFNNTEVVEWEEDGQKRKMTKGALIRHALNLAINKEKICKYVSQAEERPATFFVPPGINDYQSPPGEEYNPKRAAKLLELAGYKGGQGLEEFTVIMSPPDFHRTLAEVIQQEWKANLGINIKIAQLEWQTYLDQTTNKVYDIARAGWIPDYTDPNTFLEMWVTDGDQNNTGWSNPEYDKLIELGGSEPDPQKRLEILHQAEKLLLDELPIIPLYHYTSKNTVSQRVKGFSLNAQDKHPLGIIRIEDE